MKTINQFSKILLMTLVLTFAACSSDDGGGPVNAGEGTITASVDGQTVTSDALLTQATVATGQFSLLAIQGTNMNGDGFTLNVTGYDGVGSYEVGGDNSIFAVCTYIDSDLSNPTDPNLWTGPYEGGASVGQIVVTEVTDTHIKGTFNFKGQNPDDDSIKDITNGSFNVKIMQF